MTALPQLARDLLRTAKRADFLEAVFPQRCLVCGRFGAALHDECLADFPRAERPRCRVCWAPSRALVCARCELDDARDGFTELRTPFRFTGDARRAVLEAKFRGVTALLPVLARATAHSIEPSWRPDAVIPIPLAPNRERRRGFNQAAILANEIAEVAGLDAAPDRLRRVRSSEAQASLNAVDRATNVIGAFEARNLRGRRVLLVDDVTTTGATLNEAARAVREAGAVTVFAVAVARED